MRSRSLLICMSLMILFGFYIHSSNSGTQVAFSVEKGVGDAIDYVDNYIGKKIDMPVVAYGFVLGYAIISISLNCSSKTIENDPGCIFTKLTK